MTETTPAFRNGEDFEMQSTAGDGDGSEKTSIERATEKAKPGRKGVTAEQVFAAADSIRASRREPTVEAVQRLLGTGSTGTVAGHLRTWRMAKDGVVPVPSIPDSLAKALKEFAESACADVSKQWQARVQPVLDDNTTLTEACTRLQNEKDGQAAELAQARSECDALNGRCEQQAEENRRLRETESAAVAKYVEGEVAAAQVRQERDMLLQSLMSVDAELKTTQRKQSSQADELRETESAAVAKYVEGEVAAAQVRQERDMLLQSLMSVDAELKSTQRKQSSQADELMETKVQLARLETRLEGMVEREAEAQVRPMSSLQRPAAGRRNALVLKRNP